MIKGFASLLRSKAGADDGIRTRDLRFTKPLLYQLSYVGAERSNIASVNRASKRVKRGILACEFGVQPLGGAHGVRCRPRERGTPNVADMIVCVTEAETSRRFREARCA